MVTKGYVFIACSIDGFIADEAGGLDWLECVHQENEDYGYSGFLQRMDALLMGHNTYKKVLSFGDWPYQLPVYVLSHQEPDIPQGKRIEWLNGTPLEAMKCLEQNGIRKVYVDGGKTISQFIAEDLIEEMIISRVPVILGSGIPLFSMRPMKKSWQHLNTSSYGSGLVQSTYRCIEK